MHDPCASKFEVEYAMYMTALLAPFRLANLMVQASELAVCLASNIHLNTFWRSWGKFPWSLLVKKLSLRQNARCDTNLQGHGLKVLFCFTYLRFVSIWKLAWHLFKAWSIHVLEWGFLAILLHIKCDCRQKIGWMTHCQVPKKWSGAMGIYPSTNAGGVWKQLAWVVYN